MKIDTKVRIDAPVEEVFAVLAAVEDYADWLPPSDSYVRTALVEDRPIERGAAFVDYQKLGMQMRGEVHLFEPPKRIGFRQSTYLFLGAQISTRMEYTLSADGKGTRVVRHQVYTLPWPLRPMKLILRPKIVKENRRILDALKSAVESS